MSQPAGRLRRWIAAVTTVVAVAAVGVFVADPARAEPFAGLVEGFEGVPDDRWDVDVVAGQAEVFMGRHRLALEGTNAAQLNASSYANSAAKITRTITADPNTNFDQCGISLYLRRLAVRNEPFPTVQVSMRIRQGGPTGQIISTRGLTIADTLAWSRWAFSDNFSYPDPVTSGSRTLEIAVFRGIVLVDSLQIACGTR